MNVLFGHSHTNTVSTCAAIYSHMQCTLTLIMGIESAHWQLVCFWHRGGQDCVSKGDPRSLSFPPLFRLSCGAHLWPFCKQDAMSRDPNRAVHKHPPRPWEENKGWWKTRRREYKEKQQLVTRTHSITLTMHLQPVCVCLCLCVCEKWGRSFRELQQSTVPTHSTGGPNKNLWSVAQRVISPRCVLDKAPHRKQTLPVL